MIFIIIRRVGNARLRESNVHPLSLKIPAPQYQPIDRKKRKGKEKGERRERIKKRKDKEEFSLV